MTIQEQATDELNKIGFRVHMKSRLKKWLCEDCEIKQWTYLDNEVKRGNITETWNNEETIKVWVSDDCYYETTPAEMQRDDYRHP